MQQALKQLFPDLTDQKAEIISNYGTLIKDANQNISLVSQKTIPFLHLIQFSDAIISGKLIALNHKIDEIYDIDTGNGIPGIIFAVLYPETKVKIIEPDFRKCDFLKKACESLNLTNCTVYNSKIETISDSKMRFGLTKSFSTLTKTLINTRKAFAKGGVLFHIKGDSWANELSSLPVQLFSHWNTELLSEYKLPTTDSKFFIIKTTKLSV